MTWYDHSIRGGGMLKVEHEKQKVKDLFSAFTKQTECLLTKQNRCVLLLLALAADAAAILDIINDLFPEPISITLYVLAAVGFVMICTVWMKAISVFVTSVVLPFLKRIRIINALITDRRLRTIWATSSVMGINLIYAAFNGMIGIRTHSAWYGSLAAYYLLLSVMRYMVVSYARGIHTNKDPGDDQKKREVKVYRDCGIILSASGIALGGAVFMLVIGYGGKSYPGLMIYAVAAYTFCKLAMAIINKIKARKERSILLTTLKNISYCDAFVSLLSLQTALFAAFGQNAGELVPTMNAMTGAGVCLMISGLGIFMVHDAKKSCRQKPRLKKEMKE